MSSSEWNRELQQEQVEHYLSNDYLQSVTPRVFNYGVELELPRVCHHDMCQLTVVYFASSTLSLSVFDFSVSVLS